MINKKQIFIVSSIAVLLTVVAIFLINFNHKKTLDYVAVKKDNIELNFTKNFQPAPTPIISQNDNQVRIALAQDLDDALQKKDYVRASKINSELSAPIVGASLKLLQAWGTLRDKNTNLFPKSNDARYNYFDPQDVGADFFFHLFFIAERFKTDDLDLFYAGLSKEKEICGKLPCVINLNTRLPIPQKTDVEIFNASEYAKDGLLALDERLGDGPWFIRTKETVDALLLRSNSKRFLTTSSEVNGNMLQILSRLYWVTGDKKYLTAAENITEAYLFEELPKNNYLPTSFWDFEKETPIGTSFRLRDHGDEIIEGLGEVYFLEKMEGRPQALLYREPLTKFFKAIINIPRDKNGLFINKVDTKTGKVIDGNTSDTWGYILIGLKTFSLANGNNDYDDVIKKMMLSVSKQKSFAWEGNYADGYADSLESMIYLIKFYDLPEARKWVDSEMGVLLDKQQPSGFVEEWYLDGNFARTALMYMNYKTQGLWLEKWVEGVKLGAVYQKELKTIFVHIESDKDWKGVLRFDYERHKVFWKMPMDYPRLNENPEWYTVNPENFYTLKYSNGQEFSHVSGEKLLAGWPIEISKQGELDLKVILE